MAALKRASVALQGSTSLRKGRRRTPWPPCRDLFAPSLAAQAWCSETAPLQQPTPLPVDRSGNEQLRTSWAPCSACGHCLSPAGSRP